MTGAISRRLLCFLDQLSFRYLRCLERFDVLPINNDDVTEWQRWSLLVTGVNVFLLLLVLSCFVVFWRHHGFCCKCCYFWFPHLTLKGMSHIAPGSVELNISVRPNIFPFRNKWIHVISRCIIRLDLIRRIYDHHVVPFSIAPLSNALQTFLPTVWN